jgi:hypothetical protein
MNIHWLVEGNSGSIFVRELRQLLKSSAHVILRTLAQVGLAMPLGTAPIRRRRSNIEARGGRGSSCRSKWRAVDLEALSLERLSAISTQDRLWLP